MNNVFTKPQKIRFEHIDFAGIVFYPRFLEMLNALVEDWFEEALGWPFSEMHKTHGMPTVGLTVQFLSPARLGETLTKQLWVTKLGNASLNCAFRFTNKAGTTCLEGDVKLVQIAILGADREQIKSAPFDKEMKLKISKYLHA